MSNFTIAAAALRRAKAEELPLFALVVGVAIVNVALGFLLALLVDRLARPAAAEGSGQASTATECRRVEPAGAASPVTSPVTSPVVEAELPAEPAADLPAPETPQADLPALVAAADPARPTSLVETAIRFLQVENRRYLKQLMTLEDQARDFGTTLDQQSLAGLLDELGALNQSWLAKLADARCELSDAPAASESDGDLATELDNLLSKQRETIQSAGQALASKEKETDVLQRGQQLIGGFVQLAAVSHELRDRLDDIYSTLLHQQDRWLDRAAQWPVDDLTQLEGRIALEHWLERWQAGEERSPEPINVALVDCDRLAEINRRWGTSGGDQLLRTVADRIVQWCGKHPAAPPVFRASGQAFFLVVEQDDAQAAVAAMAQLLGSVTGEPVQLGTDELSVSLSCALARLQPGQPHVPVFYQLREAIRMAKEAGGRRLVLWQDEQAQLIDPASLLPPEEAEQLAEPAVTAAGDDAAPAAAEAGPQGH